MMSLCYGKVNEDTARLALAREMIAVRALCSVNSYFYGVFYKCRIQPVSTSMLYILLL